ncbi:unnamed protein product [Protopolystoma xenopodis]|uniref:PLAT domain-containing protein n=1 Tax=Protopolystoma xenopodis TaxID=117903 RepID=A0A3S5BQW2_9PLAT|nr:unnamed protein product [Protopolystoma xenopodis]
MDEVDIFIHCYQKNNYLCNAALISWQETDPSATSHLSLGTSNGRMASEPELLSLGRQVRDMTSLEEDGDETDFPEDVDIPIDEQIGSSDSESMNGAGMAHSGSDNTIPPGFIKGGQLFRQEEDFSLTGDMSSSLTHPDASKPASYSLPEISYGPLQTPSQTTVAATETKYHVTIQTGDEVNAGTMSNVFLRLIGPFAETSNYRLTPASPNAKLFQPNSKEVFIIHSAAELGTVERIMLWHDKSGEDPTWHVIEVKVVVDKQPWQELTFNVDKWLTEEESKLELQYPSIKYLSEIGMNS